MALPDDLRQRAVDAYEDGDGTYAEIAARFNIGTASLTRWLRRWRDRGDYSTDAGKHGRSPLHTTDENLAILKKMLDEVPDMTLDELAVAWSDTVGARVSRATTGRAVAKLGYTLRKAFRALERDQERIAELRARFTVWQGDAKPDDLIFVDESGVTVDMARTQGWSPAGEPVLDRIPRNRGTVTTLISALGMAGIVATMAIESGTSGEVFRAFATEVLLPAVQPGATVVLDNLGAHRSKETRELFASHGVHLKFLPPYSPEMNPIELYWHRLKQRLRSRGARTHAALDESIAVAEAELPRQVVFNWVRHCGYRVSTPDGAIT